MKVEVKGRDGCVFMKSKVRRVHPSPNCELGCLAIELKRS